MAASVLFRDQTSAAAQRGGGGARLSGDRAFRMLVRLSGVFVLVIMAAITAFLIAQAIPALRADTANFFTETTWFPDSTPSVFGVAALTWGTIVSSVVALAIATPIAIAVALFTTRYATGTVGRMLGYAVDLLSAVPSVVFGLWGVQFLVPALNPVQNFISTVLGWIPLFRADIVGRSLFVAGIVLAVMILPTIAALSREVLSRVPKTQIEAAQALGATRWETIKMAVLPNAKRGIVSASMLGLGRALGETIAVALVLSSSYVVSLQILEPGGATFAANIANSFGEAGTVGRGALIASGLVLFVITFAVNGLARVLQITSKKKKADR
ncbi:MAG: phosphate ABC transporter permease subunit PstC [Streptosporangiales bacterium]|nr:phosphate ABC transporter permease subunit PstC [Streptosporangiales bacterium]